MSIFSSRTPNNDPFPYVDGDGHRYSIPDGGVALAESGENAGHWVEIGGPNFKLDPRPEFDISPKSTSTMPDASSLEGCNPAYE